MGNPLDKRRRWPRRGTTPCAAAVPDTSSVADGKLELADRAAERHSIFAIPPEENRQTGWIVSITLLHLATQKAGFEKSGGYGRLLFEPVSWMTALRDGWHKV